MSSFRPSTVLPAPSYRPNLQHHLSIFPLCSDASPLDFSVTRFNQPATNPVIRLPHQGCSWEISHILVGPVDVIASMSLALAFETLE